MHRAFIYLTALLVMLASCSSGAGGEPTTTNEPSTSVTTTSSTTSTTSTTTTEAPTTTAPPATVAAMTHSPLNGEPLPKGADGKRRVLAVKIDNFPDARPQSGIEKADMMLELWVEGITRFISYWHTADADYIGPIRSIRPTDPGLVKPLGAAIVNSGGQAWVKGEFAAQDIPIIGEVRPETFRISERNAPHNLYGDTFALRGRDERKPLPEPLEPLWNFGKTPDDAEEATEITTRWGGVLDFHAGWEWDGENYLKSTMGEPHEWLDPTPGENKSDVLENQKKNEDQKENENEDDQATTTTEPAEPAQEQIAADTVIIMEMEQYVSSGSSGTSLPTTRTVGEGPAYVFSDGKVQVGTWKRENIDQWFTLTAGDGGEMSVKPGKIWVQLPPPGGVDFE